MSNSRPSSPAENSDDDSVPANDAAESDKKKVTQSEEPVAEPKEAAAEESEEAADTDDEPAQTNTPEVDLEGVRAATEISMSGGPQSSRMKWAFINLFIKLFKLGARFFPMILMLAGMSYSYIHFFGFPPIVDKVMSTPTMVKITSACRATWAGADRATAPASAKDFRMALEVATSGSPAHT